MSELIAKAKRLGAPYSLVRACCGLHTTCREMVDDAYEVKVI